MLNLKHINSVAAVHRTGHQSNAQNNAPANKKQFNHLNRTFYSSEEINAGPPFCSFGPFGIGSSFHLVNFLSTEKCFSRRNVTLWLSTESNVRTLRNINWISIEKIQLRSTRLVSMALGKLNPLIFVQTLNFGVLNNSFLLVIRLWQTIGAIGETKDVETISG